jgi:hypothetical protein
VRELHQKQNIMLNESEMMMIQIMNRAKADTDAFQLSMTRKEADRLAKNFKVPAEVDLDALVAHVSNSETSKRHYQRYLALRVCHYIEEAGMNREDFLNYLNFLCA